MGGVLLECLLHAVGARATEDDDIEEGVGSQTVSSVHTHAILTLGGIGKKGSRGKEKGSRGRKTEYKKKGEEEGGRGGEGVERGGGGEREGGGGVTYQAASPAAIKPGTT